MQNTKTALCDIMFMLTKQSAVHGVFLLSTKGPERGVLQVVVLNPRDCSMLGQHRTSLSVFI